MLMPADPAGAILADFWARKGDYRSEGDYRAKPPLGDRVEKDWRGEPPERPPKAGGRPGAYPELGEGVPPDQKLL
jgi:hypothetical protein